MLVIDDIIKVTNIITPLDHISYTITYQFLQGFGDVPPDVDFSGLVVVKPLLIFFNQLEEYFCGLKCPPFLHFPTPFWKSRQSLR